MRSLDSEQKAQFVPGLATLAADRYYGNFSVFQSLPDAWALHQVFPVMPLHRLNERPVRQGILVDITCDSDGTLNNFPLGMGRRVPCRSTPRLKENLTISESS